MDRSTSVNSPKGKRSRRSAPRQEVRCAVRFPLSIPATLSMGKDERNVTTRNVSASGVLFMVDKELRVGQDILFSLRMPGDVLGATRDILVRCSGRVVRCSTSRDASQDAGQATSPATSHDQFQAAATIDEYRFVEQ